MNMKPLLIFVAGFFVGVVPLILWAVEPNRRVKW